MLWREAVSKGSASRPAHLGPLMYPDELSECQSLHTTSWLEPHTMGHHQPQGEVLIPTGALAELPSLPMTSHPFMLYPLVVQLSPSISFSVTTSSSYTDQPRYDPFIKLTLTCLDKVGCLQCAPIASWFIPIVASPLLTMVMC